MASSIASLFGPSAEELMYNQQQLREQQQQQQLQQNLSMQSSPLAQQFYQSGYNIASGLGAGISGLFGAKPMQDPRLAQSTKLRDILGETGVNDLSDFNKVSDLAKKLSEGGFTREALYFSDRATTLKALDTEAVKQRNEERLAKEPKLNAEWVTEEGETVGMNNAKEWFRMRDMKKIDASELILKTDFNARTKSTGSASGTEEKQAQRYLEAQFDDLDLSEDDLSYVAMLIANEVKNLVAQGKVKDSNEALKIVVDEFIATKRLYKLEDYGLGPWPWQERWKVNKDTLIPYPPSGWTLDSVDGVSVNSKQ